MSNTSFTVLLPSRTTFPTTTNKSSATTSKSSTISSKQDTTTSEKPHSGQSDATKATYGLTGFLVFAIVMVLLIYVRRRCVNKRSRRRRDGSSVSSKSAEEEDEDVESGRKSTSDTRDRKLYVKDPTTADPESVPAQWNSLPDNVKYLLKGHVIDIRKIVLGKVIGKGHFGCVYEATLLASPAGPITNDYVQSAYEKVAAKTLKGDNLSVEMMEAFLREGMIMKDFIHKNVLALIGVAIDQRGVPLIVLPFMHHGCLKKYIRSSDVMLTVRDLLEFGHQIADGMRYLAEKKFVHRDLAARNCMLDEHLQVRVADFGLSRDIFTQDYYTSEDKKTKLPVKWMAPESLTKAVFSTKSDVWSYGVLLWELMTRGSTPYPDVSIWDVRAYIQAGRRMDKPDVCPEEVYSLMLRCWEAEGRNRPSFDEIYTEVHTLLHPSLTEDNENEEDGVMEHDYINIYRTVAALSQQDDDDDNDDDDKATMEDFNTSRGLINTHQMDESKNVILNSRQGTAKLGFNTLGSAV